MMLEHWEQLLSQGTLPPVLLFFGEEQFLLQEAYQLLLQRLRREDPTGMNVDVLSGAEVSPREVVERARIYPVFAERRAVVVRDAERLLGQGGTQQEVLLSYLQEPVQTTVLAFFSSAAPEALRGISRSVRNPRQQTKAKSASERAPRAWRLLLQQHAWVEFPKLYEREVVNWVAQRTRRYGFELAPPALELLLATVGTELFELNNELRKLALFAQAAQLQVLDAEHIAPLLGASRAYTVFELQQAVGLGQREEALRIAQYLQQVERQEAGVLAVLTRYFLLLWKVAELDLSAPAESLARALGVHPFFVSEYVAAFRRFGVAGVERALLALFQAERALKTGELAPEVALTQAIVQILEGATAHSDR
jgi:DNA polymerase-3 subunit delta